MRIIGVIPARFKSTRFPGKPLVKILGKPMIEWVYESAIKCSELSEVIVATDDERILKVVKNFGGKALLTSSTHNCGSERVAEAIKDVKCDVVVNIQGDEPSIKPEYISKAISAFDNPKTEVSTLIAPIFKESEYNNPNIVKVVCDKKGYALYFSRANIPYLKSSRFTDTIAFRHIGLYAFKRNTLFKFVKLPPSKLETAESLEQLRLLENGIKIQCIKVSKAPVGVDTPSDIATVEAILKKKS